MKYILLFFFISFFTRGQVVLDTIAKETCSCLKNKNFDLKNNVDLSKIEMELGLCMITNINKYNSSLNGISQIDYSNSDELTKLSGEIAVKMLNYCPEYLFNLGKNSTNIKENQKSVREVPTNLFECTIIEIKTNQFLSLIVRDSNNKLHTLLVLSYFESASLLLENKLKAGDKLMVSYLEQELYDPLIKDFRIFKIIDFLEKI